ncbi:MAG TPA: ABC transporter substrate-binding protein, partial [Chloroflexota bacterium]
RPGLTWHDGTPLTSDDFSFALAVYKQPQLKTQFLPKPQDQIDAVDTLDARTFVLRWSSVYPGAGSLGADELPPLPKHLLEVPLATVDQGQEGLDAFLNSSFWTASFVGVGPFKLDAWVQGLELDASAFNGHALGRPKIDRLIIRPVNDDNVNLTGVLGGSSTISVEGLRFEHGSVLKRDWAATGAGTVVLKLGSRHYVLTQFKADSLKTPALMDVRVRRALAYSVDRAGLNDALFDGDGYVTETFTAKQAPYNAEVQRALTKYPYDPRHSEQLMEEAGFPKGAGGLFSSLAFDFWEDGSTIYEREQQVMADTWTHAGFLMRPYIIPAAQQGDSQLRATFPGLYATSASSDERRGISIFTADEIALASNRWRGGNREGWSDANFERLWNAYNTELDRSQRTQVIVSMMKLLSDELPGIMLYFNTAVVAHSAALSGPSVDTPESMPFWNIYLWELQ